ncbi:hypothetical protein MVEN_00781500 [Mycena venus]|uniref:DUF6533 domain-containing protein n=1 Tax=Mycena venus TaxID=2733690 RepID=A0A8H7D5X3_9AGAR|nr:hypothetical protein MVEN_00781500 [Mycena venus]
MSLASSVLANRYLSAVGAVVLVYDHLWTLAEEIRLIWLNSETGVGNRIGFIVNRYITEILALYVVFGKSPRVASCGTLIAHLYSTQWRKLQLTRKATIFTAISHCIVTARVYTLWDRRPLIKWILMSSFAVGISLSFVFALLTADQAQLESNGMCAFVNKPWALPYSLGALTGLDFFIIIMTLFNALDRPRQKQAEIITNLQKDGAKFFVGLFCLRLLNLLMSIFGDATFCFVTVTIVWSMCSIVTTHVQLRFEDLRFIHHAATVGGEVELLNYTFTQ